MTKPLDKEGLNMREISLTMNEGISRAMTGFYRIVAGLRVGMEATGSGKKPKT
jgi:hypothetical protein